MAQDDAKPDTLFGYPIIYQDSDDLSVARVVFYPAGVRTTWTIEPDGDRWNVVGETVEFIIGEKPPDDEWR